MSDAEYILALLNAIQDNVKYTTKKIDHIVEVMATKSDLTELHEVVDRRLTILEDETSEMKIEVNHYTKFKNSIYWGFRVIVVAVVTAIAAAAIAMPHSSGTSTPLPNPTPIISNNLK